MLPGGLQQALFTKLLSLAIQSFRDAIGVKQDVVPGSQFAFFHRAIPFLEQAHDRTGCPQPFPAVVAAYEQGGWMATIRITQLARIIVVFSEEEASVVPRGGIFVKQLIHRAQESFGLFPGRRALAAQSRLKICHEQSGSEAFAGYVRYYQAEPS